MTLEPPELLAAHHNIEVFSSGVASLDIPAAIDLPEGIRLNRAPAEK